MYGTLISIKPSFVLIMRYCWLRQIPLACYYIISIINIVVTRKIVAVLFAYVAHLYRNDDGSVIMPYFLKRIGPPH